MSEHTHNVDWKKDFSVETLEKSQVKISGELPFEELAAHRSAAIKKLGKNVSIDGFREGKVPEAMLVEKIGEMAILTEMAERALAHAYPHIVEAHELQVLGYPQIQITKIAQDNPLGFTATVAVVPDITLPDYQTIAAQQNTDKATAEVSDADVEAQIEQIMRQRMAYERLQQKAAENTEPKKSEVTDATELPTPESEAKKAEKEFDPATAPLPELTDEYVKGLGQPGQFETVDDFKAKLREHLEIEKRREVEAAHRAKVTDAIIEHTTLELPEVLIDGELKQMSAQMEEDIKRANMNMEEYLAHIKKTEEDLRTEWRPAAEKRAKLQLVLNEIAQKEDIKPDETQLNEQVKQLMEQYKDADEMRVKVYVASVMTNEEVMKYLESL
ncbi:MAG TPA: trigger factor [Candidatus Paceibacterota bacterium]|nr:trigger factor [Candidatus Paceibacterota bacterium]